MRTFINIIRVNIFVAATLFLIFSPVSLIANAPAVCVKKSGLFLTAGTIYKDSTTTIYNTLSNSLTDFAILINQNEARLNWSIASDNNCASYYVERSVDGFLFTKTACIAAHTTSGNRYSIADNISGIESPNIYYRLAQVNKDGEINYSKPVAIRLQVDLNNFTVSPNAITNYSNIKLNWGIEETATVKVLSLNGRVLLSKNARLTLGQNDILIGEIFSLAPGNYLLQINSKHGSVLKELNKQ